MRILRFFGKATAYTWGKLCRQYLLLAGLALLCLFLPGVLGNAAQSTLESGVDFQGITLAVTAPEGDTTPETLARYMGKMRDVSRYCTVLAMDQETALQALARGEAAAVLQLPENFIGGILTGSNPDVTLWVDENRPLESLLTLWVGQSAADLLSAVQSGIYGVLTEYDASGSTFSRDQVVTDINLRYVNLTVNRQDFFTLRSLSATDMLPVDLHYSLSLLVWLCLSLAPLFFPVFAGDRLWSRRRLRAIGIGSSLCWLSDTAACTLILLPLILPALWVICGSFAAALPGALAISLFCALFAGLCCLLTGSAARCGGLSFLVSICSLFLAGGILPPPLLPKTLQAISGISPVTWLRSVAAAGLDYGISAGCPWVLLAALAAMAVLSMWLYHKRCNRQEVDG